MSTISFLNSLSSEERLALYEVMCANFGDENHEVREVRPGALSGMSLEQLKLLQDGRGTGRDGAFWAGFIQCRTFRGVAPSNCGHHRWQIRIPKAGGKLRKGSVGGLLVSGLGAKSRNRLFALGQDHMQLRVFTHHVGYLSSGGELPTDLGNGSSIDHLCGQGGCHNPAHLALATVHSQNVARINCDGITLVVVNQLIVQEQACAHAAAGAFPNSTVLDSCRKVKILCLDEIAVEAVVKHCAS